TRSDVSALSRDLRPERPDYRDDGLHRRTRARHPQDTGRPIGHAACADQRRQELQFDQVAAILEDPVSCRAANHLRWTPARFDLRADQYRWSRISDQFRRPRTAY